MITDDHKQAIQELLKLVQAKMGGDNPEEEMAEMGTQPDTEGAPDSPSLEEMSAEQGEGPEEGDEPEVNSGLDASIIEDMKKKFSGREDLNMPAGKKGVRMGITEISAIPMKKPMRK